jgi:coproporphyrinogen III oxidase-like Fe-S oxidoreductase
MLEDGLYPKEWKKYSITEEEMEKEYREICGYFDSLGWHHYEISNWSKPLYQCNHNQ